MGNEYEVLSNQIFLLFPFNRMDNGDRSFPVDIDEVMVPEFFGNAKNWELTDPSAKYLYEYILGKVKLSRRDKGKSIAYYEYTGSAGELYARRYRICSERDGSAGSMPFRVEKIGAFLFDTGSVLVTVKLALLNPGTLCRISDFLYEIKKMGTLVQPVTEDGRGASEGAAGAGASSKEAAVSLLKMLIETTGISNVRYRFSDFSRNHTRVNIFAQADVRTQEAGDPEQSLYECIREDLYYLRNAYSAERFSYVPEDDDASEIRIPSEAQVWGISQEAVVCVTDSERSREDFIRKRFVERFGTSYLFLFALLQHEKYVMYHMLTGITPVTYNDLAALEQYKDNLDVFKANYFYFSITEVRQYQELYEKIKEVYRLEELYRNLNEPIISLGQIQARNFNRTQEDKNAFLNLILAVLSVVSLLSVAIDVLNFHYDHPKESGFFLLIVIALAALTATVALLVHRRRVHGPGIRYRYCGWFFDRAEIEEDLEQVKEQMKGIEEARMRGNGFLSDLQIPVGKPHVTDRYKPRKVRESLFGRAAEFEIIGYGNDGKNQGFLVKMTDPSREMQKICRKVRLPHITLSLAEDAEAVHTARIDFVSLPHPIRIRGVYGAYTKEDDKVWLLRAR